MSETTKDCGRLVGLVPYVMTYPTTSVSGVPSVFCTGAVQDTVAEYVGPGAPEVRTWQDFTVPGAGSLPKKEFVHWPVLATDI
jgi:hypothetical protein